MRLKASTFAVVLSATSWLAGAALADGLPAPGGSIKDAPIAAPPSRLCYVRADLGYGWSASEDGFATITPPGLGIGSGKVQDSRLDSAWFGEVGAGCALVPGLRGDITFGFHGGRDFHGVPVNPPAPPPSFVDPVSAKAHANTLMFNLYYDLPRFGLITPYIGAGVGMAFVELRDTTFTDGVVVRLPNKSDTNFAWSLMAGVGTDLGRGVVLDVGYRYLNMGEIGVSSPAIGYNLRLNDLSEHQFRAGVRIPVTF